MRKSFYDKTTDEYVKSLNGCPICGLADTHDITWSWEDVFSYWCGSCGIIFKRDSELTNRGIEFGVIVRYHIRGEIDG